MPILKQEPSLLPESLFDDGFQEERRELGANWWAVYTMSRREKELMRKLAVHSVPFYCPIVRKRSRSPQGRVRTSFLPLFPNYVFMCATEEQRVQAFSTNCISRCLPVPDATGLVHDLAQIEQILSSDRAVTPESHLIAGTRVRIRTGTFAGVEGTVFQRRNESRLLISVDFLQAGASLEISDFDVEKIY
ncbi:MAG: transcription termination/antitermination protein NusG [Maioricimonas sp. JB049]